MNLGKFGPRRRGCCICPLPEMPGMHGAPNLCYLVHRMVRKAFRTLSKHGPAWSEKARKGPHVGPHKSSALLWFFTPFTIYTKAYYHVLFLCHAMTGMDNSVTTIFVLEKTMSRS